MCSRQRSRSCTLVRLRRAFHNSLTRPLSFSSALGAMLTCPRRWLRKPSKLLASVGPAPRFSRLTATFRFSSNHLVTLSLIRSAARWLRA